jgi:hypothetical protein
MPNLEKNKSTKRSKNKQKKRSSGQSRSTQKKKQGERGEMGVGYDFCSTNQRYFEFRSSISLSS